jgi:hypothetical protein
VRAIAAALPLGAVAGVGLASSCLALGLVPNLVEAPHAFLAGYAAAFACYVLGVSALGTDRSAPSPRAALVLVLGVALAARITLLPSLPTLSTDAYRYVWDARVASAGLDPYAYAPSAPELRPLRDDSVYPRLNHLSWRTIYPPGAQALFRAVYALAPDSVRAMKTAVALAELVVLVLLLVLLARLGLPSSRLVVYAWNPLLLVEVWGSGHLDGLVLPVTVGATLAAVAGHPVLVAALLAAGTLVKLYPAVLFPMLTITALERMTRATTAGAGTARSRVRHAVVALTVFVGTIGIGYAPLAGLGTPVLGSLPRYLREEDFNRGLVRTLVDDPAVTLAALAVWVAWATCWRAGEPIGARARRLIGGFTVLQPNVFPWYALSLIPFLALAPSPAWVAFTGTVALAYTFFLDTPWAIPLWARVLEATAVLFAVVAGLHALRPARLRRARSRPHGEKFTAP